MPSLEVREELCVPPSDDEVLAAMSTLRSGKAGGKFGVLPDMLKCCGANLLRLSWYSTKVWKDGCVPQEWKDALIVPIPKKGETSVYVATGEALVC